MTVFPTRYQAEKYRKRGEEVVVKVTGGYAVMTYREYRIWKAQK